MNNTLFAEPVVVENGLVNSDKFVNKAVAEPNIVLDNISVSFKTAKGSFTAVKDISLTVNK